MVGRSSECAPITHVDGTNFAEEIVQKYRKTWEDIGLVDKNALLKQYVLSKTQPSAS